MLWSSSGNNFTNPPGRNYDHFAERGRQYVQPSLNILRLSTIMNYTKREFQIFLITLVRINFLPDISIYFHWEEVCVWGGWVCVRACVCAYVCLCVRARGSVRARVRACVCLCVYVYVYEGFISPSVWMIPVDTSVQWAKHRNLGLCQSFVMLFFYFYLLNSHKSLE